MSLSGRVRTPVPRGVIEFRRSQPMDFGIGYRWRTHESNLLLAVRVAVEALVAAAARLRQTLDPAP